MPLKKCTKNGKSGWKWGDSGTCYHDKKKALKQGQAIELSKKRRGEKSEFDKAEFLALDKSEQVDIMREAGMSTAEQVEFLLANSK